MIRPDDYVCDSLFFKKGESRGEGAMSGEENTLMSWYDNQESIELFLKRGKIMANDYILVGCRFNKNASYNAREKLRLLNSFFL